MKTYDPYNLEHQKVLHGGGDEYHISQDFAQKVATKNNLAIVLPDENTLQLDIDDNKEYQHFINKLAPTLIEHMEVSRIWWVESKGGNKHVYIRLKKQITPIERIAFQAALGSDRLRELLGALRLNYGQDNPTLFFEKPDVVETVIYATDGYQPSLTAGNKVEQSTDGNV